MTRARPLACTALFLLVVAAHAAPSRIVLEWGWGDKTKLHWDGEITVEDGTIIAAENHMMDGPETYYDLTEASVKFNGLTEGGQDGIILEIDGAPDTLIKFNSPIKQFELRLGQVRATAQAISVNDVGAKLTYALAPVKATKTPRQECRKAVRGADGSVWTVGVETDGPETEMASRQRIVLARWEEQTWEPVADITEPGILYFPDVAADPDGGLWIAWAQFDDRNWDVYARHFDGEDLGRTKRLSRAPGPDLIPAVVATETRVVAVWQTGNSKRFGLIGRAFIDDDWGGIFAVTDSSETAYRPVLATAPDASVWLAYDAYQGPGRDYDVFLREITRGGAGDRVALMTSEREEIDASLAIDRSNTVWVAASGQCIGYRAGQLVLPPPALVNAAGRPSMVATDPMGRLCLFTPRRGRPGAAVPFRTAVAANGADPVSLAVAMNGSPYRAPLVDADGTVWAATESAVATVRVPLPKGYPTSPTVKAALAPPPVAPPESLPTAFERQTVDVDGEALNVYYGELHTHLDEHPTGTIIRTWVDRFYNNARDAIGLDIASISDHDWPRMTVSKFMAEQAFPSVMNDPGNFLACIGWEWSGSGKVRYRYGDRTVVFQEDYCDILRITDEQGDEPAKLHAYLKSQGAIDWPHHVGAIWAVMDWDTLSPTIEPVVEVVSTHGVYETYDEGRAIGLWHREPKISRDDSGDKTSIQSGLSQGHKFGLVGSSDSHNGLAGYKTGMLGVFAPELTREAIFDAWRARRTYAVRGGERMLVDFRVNDTFMGGEVTTKRAPRLAVSVEGTAPIEKIEVIRNNEYVYTAEGSGDAIDFEYLDMDAEPGDCYYYIRVFQEGDCYAWSSPVWVTVQ